MWPSQTEFPDGFDYDPKTDILTIVIREKEINIHNPSMKDTTQHSKVTDREGNPFSDDLWDEYGDDIHKAIEILCVYNRDYSRSCGLT